MSESSKAHEWMDHARIPTDATLSTPQFTQRRTSGDAEFVPPAHSNRTLVLCFDGTGDQFDQDNSNIVQFFSLLKKDNSTEQRVYYQAGIGTYTTPQIATPFMAKLTKKVDEMIAWNLNTHVIGGYEFLMETYTSGDRICIFGFSRGAYTARALAGMLHKVGLLPPGNHQQVPFAYKMYSHASETGWKQSTAFKKSFAINVSIDFLGVWDTVNSCGIIPRRLPFTTSNSVVRVYRHALALDERRAKFKPNLWNRPRSDEEKLGFNPMPRKPNHDDPFSNVYSENGGARDIPQEGNNQRRAPHHKATLRDLERTYAGNVHATDIEEVWFSGCHCDIGGGSVDNGTPASLARLSLRWMIRQIFNTDVGIMFNTDGLRGIGLDPNTLYPSVTLRPPAIKVDPLQHKIESRPRNRAVIRKLAAENAARAGAEAANDLPVIMARTEEEEELLDVLSPIYDQLSMKWMWWLGEIIPLHQRYQRGDNTWVTGLVANMGKPRFIPKQRVRGVKIHRSVKMRMEAAGEHGRKYVPKAKFAEEFVTWVD